MNITLLLNQEEMLQKMLSVANKYAAIYSRRSILSDNGSLDVQTKSCTTYAAKNKLIVYKVYAEAISAVKNDVEHRAALLNMLEDARNGLFKSLIISKRDRLARNFEDYLIRTKVAIATLPSGLSL